ncbi:MAG: hypothetical protein LBR21_08255 [Propionibacteriaceae bacterium]|jgi:hypothetical protein|nr:hypothetical protein [Propionibacteriaceae bacterium]
MWTGVLFAAIVAIWLLILVPHVLSRRKTDAQVEQSVFSPDVTIVHTEDAAESADALETVSTPLTRRAERQQLHYLQMKSVFFRRRVLVGLTATELVVVAVAAFGVVPWWTAAVPAAVMLGYLGFLRLSVRRMERKLERCRAEIFSGGDEETVIISDSDLAQYEQSIELDAPFTQLNSLWDPIPITKPTYVQRPLSGRTVRTIDLSAPPVVNDTEEIESKRAFG